MATVIQFPEPKVKPLVLKYCDEPNCVKCRPVNEWTEQDWDFADAKEREIMLRRGYVKNDSNSA